MTTPNVTPDLAGKVLAAELRNTIKAVSDGGTLPASHRKMMQEIAITPELAGQQRAAALLSKYCAGHDLTLAQWEEIRAAHPAFSEQPPPPSVEAGLELTPEPSPANGDVEVSRVQLDAWAALYGTQHRQLRRWILRGKEKNDPCPLDNPAAMPAWIDLHLEKVRGDTRARVLDAAQAACSKNPPAVENSNTASEEASPKTDQPTAAARTTPELPKVQSFDLATVGGVEGELVDIFRQVVAATRIQLQEAYKDGTEARIQSLLKRIESTGESLRKHEAAAELKAKRSGDLMSKAESYEMWIELIKMFAQLREQRRKRMRSELASRPETASLPPETIEAFLDSVDVVTVEEEKIFQNLGSIKSADDILFQLAA